MEVCPSSERELLSDQNAKMPLAAHPSLSVLKRAGYFCILSPVREKMDCDYWSRPQIIHSHIRDILSHLDSRVIKYCLKTHNMSRYTLS